MIQGIQITKAANDQLLNSIWLLDSEKSEARCVAATAAHSASAGQRRSCFSFVVIDG